MYALIRNFFYSFVGRFRPFINRMLPVGARAYLKKRLSGRLFFPDLERIATEEWRKARIQQPWIPAIKRNSGVNLIGYFQTVKGIGEAARSSVTALNAMRIPYSVIDFEYGIPKDQQTISIPDPKLGFIFNTNLFHINPPQLPYVWWNFHKQEIVGRYGIGVWYWELPEFPKEWLPAFNLLDEVWVATQFVLDGLNAKSPLPVVKIPPCISIQHDGNLDRSSFNLPEDRFLFMCAYDVLSVQERKNPQGAIAAFKQAFKNDDSSVGMVIKVSNAAASPHEILSLRENIRGYTNCYIIDDMFDKAKFNSLLNLVDAFVSLHRCEGFGLIPAEAMYMGKPVIMTRWSGNADFMTDDNSCGVDYKLVSIDKSAGPYPSGQVWADPDVPQAAYYMQRLVSNPQYCREISTRAQTTIRQLYSPEKIGGMIKDRLQKIGLM